MSKANPTDRRYSKDHEWALDNGDGTVTMGITDHAQHLLTDIVFVELPEVGQQVEAHKAMAVVESVKSVSDVYAPVDGEIIEINQALEDEPEIINNDAFEAGWIAKIKVKDAAQMDDLLSSADYDKLIAE